MKDRIKIEDITYVKESTDEMKYCIVRCRLAGVHAGYVKKESDIAGTITLIDSRRLHYWQTVAMSLSGLGQRGIPEENDCKFAVVVPSLMIPLNDIAEIQPCAEFVMEQIQAVKEWIK